MFVSNNPQVFKKNKTNKENGTTKKKKYLRFEGQGGDQVFSLLGLISNNPKKQKTKLRFWGLWLEEGYVETYNLLQRCT